MHGRAAGKVQTAHDEAPAVGTPGPAGNKVVDEGGPEENEDEGRQDTATLCGGADGECGGQGGEHSLEEHEDDVRDLGGADGGLIEDVAEEGVVEVADEAVAGFTEG